MRIVILCLMTLGLFGCTKSPVCDAAKMVSGAVAGVVASQLNCSKPDAIKKTIDDMLSKTKICQAPAMGAKSFIGDMICPSLIDGVLDSVKAKIPTEWGCSGSGAIEDGLKDILMNACRGAI